MCADFAEPNTLLNLLFHVNIPSPGRIWTLNTCICSSIWENTGVVMSGFLPVLPVCMNWTDGSERSSILTECLLRWWTRVFSTGAAPDRSTVRTSTKRKTKYHMSAEHHVKYLCLHFFGWITWPNFIESFYQSSMGNLVNTGLECQSGPPPYTCIMHRASICFLRVWRLGLREFSQVLLLQSCVTLHLLCICVWFKIWFKLCVCCCVIVNMRSVSVLSAFFFVVFHHSAQLL